MDLSQRAAAQMKLVGGRLCLDFVNTIGGRRFEPSGEAGSVRMVVLNDKLEDYFDLLAWSRRAGLLTAAEMQALIGAAKRRADEAAAVLKRAKKLREAIHGICRALIYKEPVDAADLELLNLELAEARDHERLAVMADRFVWTWTGTPNALARMLWPVARSAAEMLTMADLSRLRECGGEDCHWLFEDTSRNRSRQWCDMQACGNLAKVRRFRARRRRLPTQTAQQRETGERAIHEEQVRATKPKRLS
jgi:predicted RNA-binding Zn ribbon-like protein